jgi:hypothetical protein
MGGWASREAQKVCVPRYLLSGRVIGCSNDHRAQRGNESGIQRAEVRAEGYRVVA